MNHSSSSPARTLTGTGVGQGIAVAPIAKMGEPLPVPADDPSDIPLEEAKASAREALATVAQDLRAKGAQAGGEAQEVLEAQALMAEDPGLTPLVDGAIDAGKSPARAIYDAFTSYRGMLEMMGGYMAERVADLDDVRQRVIATVQGVPVPGVPQLARPFILVAHDLAPADTALLDLDVVKALVTSEGGPTSHTAILARAKGIPAIVGARGVLELADGDEIIVNAGQGTVIVHPTGEQRRQAEAEGERLAQRTLLTEGPGRTRDGHPVNLLANVGSAADAPEAVAAGVEGVGLFRTEFLFLDSPQAPSLEAQTRAYTELLSHFPGRKVVARTLDAGADKPLAFLDLGEEPNPALGQRGLRATRTDMELFETQLKALAAAADATEADLWVMAPMVVDVEDTQFFVDLAKGLGLKTVGVMVETPSAALLAQEILDVADFVSVGTNDLTQYTLAADRMLGATASLQNPWHPSVLRLIGSVGQAGTETGKPVGICGEAGADPLLAAVLVGLGVNSLSMSSSAVAEVRTLLAELTLAQCQAIAQAATGAGSASKAREAADAAYRTHETM